MDEEDLGAVGGEGDDAGDEALAFGAADTLVKPATGGPGVTALVRPESVVVVPDPDGEARVVSTAFLGPTSRITVAVGESTVVAQVGGELLAQVTVGAPVRVELRAVPVALQD